METPATYHLFLLGAPYAVASNGTTIHLSRRLAWCLLARLTEYSGFLSRETLCKEFMTEDAPVSANNLSQAITECRRAFRRKAFESDRGRLRLSPGIFTTDIQQFADKVKQAKETDDIKEQTALLASAFALVRDDFLTGYAKGNFDWIALQRTQWEARITSVGQQLRELWESQNNMREARAVADRLGTLFPHDAANFPQIVLLSSAVDADCNAPRNGSLIEWIGFAKSLTKCGLTFKSEEKVHFENLLQAYFLQLSSELRTALKRLSILEGSFDALLAEEVCQVTPEQLSDLTNDALLTKHGGLFEIPSRICDWIGTKVNNGEREKWEQAYKSGLIRHRQRVESLSATDQQRREYFQINHRHFAHVFSRIHHKIGQKHHALTAEELELYLLSLLWLELPTAASDFALLCEHAAQFPAPKLYPGNMEFSLSCVAFHLRIWNQGIAYAKAALAFFEKHEDKVHFLDATITLIGMLHHSGQSEAAADLGIATCERIRHWKSDGLVKCDSRRFTLYNQLSEILSALKRYDESLHYSELIIEAIASGQWIAPAASPFYRQGTALRGLGRDNEARIAYNRALDHFSQINDLHGIADCKQNLGVMMAEIGLTMPGEEYVREALQIYADIPQMQSRAACLRSLGDVLKIKGDHKGAQAAYCEGLSFWENEVDAGRGGSGWVRRFCERLGEFHSVADSRE